VRQAAQAVVEVRVLPGALKVVTPEAKMSPWRTNWPSALLIRLAPIGGALPRGVGSGSCACIATVRSTSSVPCWYAWG
jgi:hypothetical protein